MKRIIKTTLILTVLWLSAPSVYSQTGTQKQTTTKAPATKPKAATPAPAKPAVAKQTPVKQPATSQTASKQKPATDSTNIARTANTQLAKVESAAPQSGNPSSPTIGSSSQPKAVSATADNAKAVYANPFQKGTLSMINRQNIDYDKYKHMPDNSKNSALFVGIDLNYFVANGFAVGIALSHNNSRGDRPYSTYRYTAGFLNLTYGRQITDRIGAYLRVGGGTGSSRSEFKNGSITTILNATYKNIHASIAAPIALLPNSGVFLTPSLTWDKTKTKAANHDITDKGINFAVKLESYINNKYGVAAKVPAKRWPQQGTSFIEYQTDLNIGGGKRIEFQGTTRFGDVKKSNMNLNVGYHYYFMDWIAGGLNLAFIRTKTDNSSVDLRSRIIFEPVVTVHPPIDGALHSLFLELGYAFEKAKISGIKEDNKYLTAELGYNIFVTQNISLSPKVGYEGDKLVHHTAGGEYEYHNKGLAAELGLRVWLRKK